MLGKPSWRAPELFKVPIILLPLPVALLSAIFRLKLFPFYSHRFATCPTVVI